MSKKHWFAAKNYGWGWGMPQTWQGWLSFLVFAAVLVGSLLLLVAPYTDSEIPPVNLVVFYCVLALDVFMLVAVSYRYGETPKWRWAGKALKKQPRRRK